MPKKHTESAVLASGIPVHCAHSEIVDAATLVPNPRNPNTHPDEQVRLLAKMIVTQGWRCPITISNRSGFIVRGHARLMAAQAAGLEQVPVDRQDYENEAAEWADLIADNRIAELAELDRPVLKDVLEELDTGALDMELTGFTENALANLMSQYTIDPDTEWVGMPEYDQPNFPFFKTLIVRFMTEQDYIDFGKLVEQSLTDKTKSIWIPKQSFDELGKGQVYSVK